MGHGAIKRETTSQNSNGSANVYAVLETQRWTKTKREDAKVGLLGIYGSFVSM